MELFSSHAQLDIMAQTKKAAVLSVILVLLSIAALSYYGLNLGLDFTGGLQLQVHCSQSINAAALRELLQGNNYQQITVSNYGSPVDFLITIPTNQLSHHLTSTTTQSSITNLANPIVQLIPGAQLQAANFIGGQVSSNSMLEAIGAIALALLATMVYITLRFEWRTALGATCALIHDPIIIMGVFAYWRLEFNLLSLAAILTVIAYSLNDSIVIFDRVRENFMQLANLPPRDIINQAVTQTLSRTIITSSLIFTVVLILYCGAGPIVHNFALALGVGIIVGTYSSIYIASALALGLGLTRMHMLPKLSIIQDSEHNSL